GDRRLRHPARRRTRVAARRWAIRDEFGRRRRPARQLAWLVPSEPRQPDGVRDDGRFIQGLSMSQNTKPVRRIVCIDENEKSRAISDAPVTDIKTDPARPGYSATRVWLTDRTPACIAGIT